jgi:hypothetical protein
VADCVFHAAAVVIPLRALGRGVPVKTPIRQPNPTCEQLRTAIGTWIERTHHRRCRQVGLGRLTPIEFEATYDHTGRSGPRNRICYLVVRQTQR